MKEKVFQTVAILLSLFLVLTLFTGCERSEQVTETDGTSQESESSGEEETVEVDPFGKYDPSLTVQAARYIDPNLTLDPEDSDRASFEENIWAKAYKENLGVEFDYVWTAPFDQYENRWNLAMASKNIPDMAVVPVNIFMQLAEADMLEDMTEIFEKYASPLYKKAQEDDYGITRMYGTVNGKLLGLPINGVVPENAPILFVRKDWLDNVGLDVPRTVEEFYEVAKAFTNNDPNKSGKNDTYGLVPDLNFRGIFNSFGAYRDSWVLDNDGKMIYGNVQPEVKDALLMMRNMYSEGIIPTDFVVREAEMGSDISAEKAGMTFGVFWTPLTNIKDTIMNNPDAEWVVAPIPHREGKISKAQDSVQPQGMFIVKKGYENPEVAVKLLNLDLQLINDDQETYAGPNMLHKFRISGEIAMPWRNLNAHLAVQEVFEGGDASALTAFQQIVYDGLQKARDGNRDILPNQLVFDKDGTYDVIHQYRQNDRLMIDPYQTAPTENMLEKGPALNDMIEETYYSIIMGEDSIDAFDSMVDNWFSMGGTEITREANEWLESVK